MSAFIFALLASVQFSATNTGNNLIDQCGIAVGHMDTNTAARAPLSGSQQIDSGYCLGLVHGIAEAARANEIAFHHQDFGCPPRQGIETGQAARIVLKFLQDHPEKLHQPDSLIAIEAIRDAFPCVASKKHQHK